MLDKFKGYTKLLKLTPTSVQFVTEINGEPYGPCLYVRYDHFKKHPMSMEYYLSFFSNDFEDGRTDKIWRRILKTMTPEQLDYLLTGLNVVKTLPNGVMYVKYPEIEP
jgi:hypothetical protein